MKPNTTIMMVTCNRLDLTKETIEKALTHTGREFNLVVADNNSTDNTIEFLEQLKNTPPMIGYQFKQLSKNHGIAYGRNICLNMMLKYFPDTKYLVTMDNDVAIPNKNWLTDCIDVLETIKNAGTCAINYERKTFPKTTITTSTGKIINLQIILNTPGTATTVFPREIFDKIGYFKSYGTYGHDDANMFVRIRHIKHGGLFYLDEPGEHLGDGNRDVGEYREMKTREFNKNYPAFVKDMRDYANGRQKLYVPFSE